MKELKYTDKTGKPKDIEYHVATLPTFWGVFVVNIIENVDRTFRLLISVPPNKRTICSPATYCLDGWEELSFSQAKYKAHVFIKEKRVRKIQQEREYRAMCKRNQGA